MQQIPLNLRLRDSATFENFVVGPNQTAAIYLQNFSPGGIFLWGQPGTGRTHLLNASCHQLGNSVYLPLREATHLSPEMFSGLDSVACVCIDDVDAIAGQRMWEEALFHLYNHMEAHQTRLILTANTIPSHLNLTLPDLTSRLNACMRFQILPLSDTDKLVVLQQRARAKGLELSEEVGNYVLNHYSRDLSALLTLLDQLDHASLASQRRLTIPFVKAVLD